MKYKKINGNEVLRKVCVKSYRVHTDEWIVLQEFGDCTVTALCDKMKTDCLSSPVLGELANPIPKEVMLSYYFNDEEVLIDIINTTSDVIDEVFGVDLASNLFQDSIKYGYDFCIEVNDAFLRNPAGCKTVEEYYDKVYRKNALLNVLISYFMQDGFTVNVHFSNVNVTENSTEYVVKMFECFNADNLVYILDDYEGIREVNPRNLSVNTFLAEASRKGYLVFDPYIKLDEHGDPTLVLKYNRYVHLFRGYYYQCSYTEEGFGEYSSAGIRIDYIRKFFKDRDMGDSKLLKQLYYMNLIICCNEMEAFQKLLKNNPGLVDSFMKLSTSKYFRSFEVTYESLISETIVPVSHEAFNNYRDGDGVIPCEIYRISRNDTSDFGRVNIYKSELIGIEYWGDNAPTETYFKLCNPFSSYMEAAGLADDYGVDDVDAFMEETLEDIYDMYEVRCTLCAFALNVCKFISNFIVTYPTDERRVSALRRLNRENIPEFKNLGVLYRK